MSNLIKIDTIELSGLDLVSFYYQSNIVFTCKHTAIPDLIVQGDATNESHLVFTRGTEGVAAVDVKLISTIISPAFGTVTYTPLVSGVTADEVTARAISVFDYLVHHLFQGCCGVAGGPSEGTVTSVAFDVSIAVDALEVLGGPITTSGAFMLNFLGSDTQYVRGDGTLATFPTTGQGPLTWLWNGGLVGPSGYVTSVNFTGSAVNDVSYASGALTVDLVGGGAGSTPTLDEVLTVSNIAFHPITWISDVDSSFWASIQGNPDGMILSAVNNWQFYNWTEDTSVYFDPLHRIAGGSVVGGDVLMFDAGSNIWKATDLTGAFIPLAGTVVGSPVTGNIEMLDGGDVTLFAQSIGDDYYDKITWGVGNLTLQSGNQDQSLNTTFIIQKLGQILVNSTYSTFEGIQYGADYSANYTARSLVDKEYVDTHAGSASWGSIGAGTGVGSQTDLVTYLDQHYIPLAGTGSGSPVTGFIQMGNSGDDASLYSESVGDDFYERITFGVATIQLYAANNAISEFVSLNVSKNDFIIDTNLSTFAGARYGADYSANYTLRSLVDKEYVDNAISGAGGLPPQTGHAGEWLTTNGTTASWNALSGNVSLFTNDAGYITSSALTGYVPYTGATTDVDLGTHILNAQSIHAKGTGGNGHFGLKHQSAAATAAASESVLYADNHGDLVWKNDSLSKASLIMSGITADRTYYYPNASGTLALTSDIPSVSPAALTKTDDTNVTLSLGGTPATSLLQAVSLTLGWSGTLSIARGGTNSGTALSNNRVMQSSGGAIVEAAAITAARALISDANGIPTHSAVTSTELGYVSGVTSAIQTQIDALAGQDIETFMTTTISGMTINSGVVRYYVIDGVLNSNTITGNTGICVKIPKGGTLQSYNLRTTTSQPATGALAFTIQTGSSPATLADTAMVITVAAGSAAGDYNTGTTATLTDGYWICQKMANGASTASASITGTTVSLKR